MAWKSRQSYSTDLRSRVLASIDGGNPARTVARLLSVSYIDKALARRDTTGETEARPQRNRQTLKLAAHHAAIAAEVARRPDAALEELRAWLLATHPSRPAPPGCSCSSPGRFRSPQSAWSVPLLRLPTEPSTGEVEGRAIP